MSKKKIFSLLATASLYTGIGMIFGYLLSEGPNNTPLWVGGALVILGAVLLGMYISSGPEDRHTIEPQTPTDNNLNSKTGNDGKQN